MKLTLSCIEYSGTLIALLLTKIYQFVYYLVSYGQTVHHQKWISVGLKKQDGLAQLEADPANATPQLGKIYQFQILHFTSP